MSDADAAAVAALSVELGYPTTAEDVLHRFYDLGTRRDNAMFVAENEGVVVGWAHAYGVRLLETDGYVDIGGIVVGSNHRREGIGQALLRCAEQWAAVSNYREVRLRSGLHREDAHRFYVASGYAQSEVSYVFRRVV